MRLVKLRIFFIKRGSMLLGFFLMLVAIALSAYLLTRITAMERERQQYIGTHIYVWACENRPAWVILDTYKPCIRPLRVEIPVSSAFSALGRNIGGIGALGNCVFPEGGAVVATTDLSYLSPVCTNTFRVLGEGEYFVIPGEYVPEASRFSEFCLSFPYTPEERETAIPLPTPSITSTVLQAGSVVVLCFSRPIYPSPESSVVVAALQSSRVVIPAGSIGEGSMVVPLGFTDILGAWPQLTEHIVYIGRDITLAPQLLGVPEGNPPSPSVFQPEGVPVAPTESAPPTEVTPTAPAPEE